MSWEGVPLVRDARCGALFISDSTSLSVTRNAKDDDEDVEGVIKLGDLARAFKPAGAPGTPHARR